MGKVRLVLLAALAVSLGLVVVLSQITFNGWMVWLGRVAMVVAGTFAMAVTGLLLATIFRTNGDDLWDTGYFRYMRAFWGETWGGRGHNQEWKDHRYIRVAQPLQISTCRATWLSVVALLIWILVIGLWGYLIYFFAAGTLQGFENTSPIWNNEKMGVAGNLFFICFFFVFWGTMLLFIMLLPIGLKSQFKRDFPRFHRGLKLACYAYASMLGLLALVIVPIKYAGFGPYLKGVGIIALGVAVIVVVFWGLWWLFATAVHKLQKFFKKETVPGALISAHHEGWKQKFCPLLIQTIKEDKPDR